MTRVRLAIVRGPHQPSLAAGQQVLATRIVAKIGFETSQGWTSIDSIALVDTGAPLSLFPEPMWRNIDRQVLAPLIVGGVAEKPECKFSADLAVVHCMISDGVETLGPYRIQALLAHNDKVPPLLGLAGALEEVDLSVMLRRDFAYLEGP